MNNEENTVNPDLVPDKISSIYKDKDYQARLNEFEGPPDILLHFV